MRRGLEGSGVRTRINKEPRGGCTTSFKTQSGTEDALGCSTCLLGVTTVRKMRGTGEEGTVSDRPGHILASAT